MAPGKRSKDEKHLEIKEYLSEKNKTSSVKRKRDCAEQEKEPQVKKLLVKKAGNFGGKNGGLFPGSVIRNTGMLFCRRAMQNIVQYVYQNMLGATIGAQQRKCLQVPFVRSLNSYRLFRTASPFDRRITCLEWHPTHPSTVAVGSKGGDIILWDYEVRNKSCFVKGMGAGGAITGMKFNPFNPSELYTSSVAGTTALQDFNGNTIQVFTNTNDWWYDALQFFSPLKLVQGNKHKELVKRIFFVLELNEGCGKIYQQLRIQTIVWENGRGDSLGGMKFSPFESAKLYVASGDGTLRLHHLEGQATEVISCIPVCDHEFHDVCFWYCSVDVSAVRRTVVTGDNVGNVVLLSTNGEKIWNLRLHKKKVTHVEFNSRCDWLLASASVDQTVKIWDMRNIKNNSSYLHVLPHDKPVNAAYFSPTDGAKLLSTDQHNEIRVYTSSDWSKPQHLISHPHRQFQHLTPIKATWHPRYDLIVAGRYPDPKFPGFTVDELRTVDIFDGNSGTMVCQLHDPNASGIISLNKFNPMGDTLASGMGFNILIWTREEMLMKEQECLSQSTSKLGTSSRSLSQPRGQRQRQSNTGANNLKSKLFSLEVDKTKTKGKDCKLREKKRKGKDLED